MEVVLVSDKEKREEIKAEKIEKKKSEKFNELTEEVEKLKAETNHWKNEYYRAYADTKNLRNNLEKEHREALKYRAEGFIEELLPVLDSFHSVLANEVEDPALKNYLVGFQYVYRNLVSVLENEGVSEISPSLGSKFDPNVMAAVDTIEGEDNVITKVYSLGYKLHDRIIRPANVQVSIVPQKVKEENSDEENNHLDA